MCHIKTGKLMLSIGLHMGWNLAQALVRSSPEESRSALFKLVQDHHAYHPLNVLLPYLGITLILIFFVWRLKPSTIINQ